MHDFTGFMKEPIKEIVKEIVDMTEKVGVKVFQDMDLGEIQELRDTTEELTKEDLMEMSASKSVTDKEEDIEEAVSENKLTLYSLEEGF